MKNTKISGVISIAIVEDIEEIRESLFSFLKEQPNFLCEHAVDSVEEFLKINFEILPDIILLDIGLPGMSGIAGMSLIKGKCPGAEIIVITVYDDHNKIYNALCAGASGYLLKTTPLNEITNAIEEVYNGGAPMSPQIARKVIAHFKPSRVNQPENSLTEKEKAVIASLVDGLSYKMIAMSMNNSIDTIRHHIKNIYQKLHVHSKAEVISKSLKGEI